MWPATVLVVQHADGLRAARVEISAHRKPKGRRLEFAEVVRTISNEVYPETETIRLVCDNFCR